MTLRSTEPRPGANITFTFAGTAAGETISGTLYMGEYLDATYRHPAPVPRGAARDPYSEGPAHRHLRTGATPRRRQPGGRRRRTGALPLRQFQFRDGLLVADVEV